LTKTIRGAPDPHAVTARVNSKCGPPDGYQWQGDERQKNVETIPSRISVQNTTRRTDSSVASREVEGDMTHDLRERTRRFATSL
jgi:hypothetical protein